MQLIRLLLSLNLIAAGGKREKAKETARTAKRDFINWSDAILARAKNKMDRFKNAVIEKVHDRSCSTILGTHCLQKRTAEEIWMYKITQSQSVT